MSSKLALDAEGFPVVIETALGGERHVWRPLGNDLGAGDGKRWRWLGHSKARPPTEKEMAEALVRSTARLPGASTKP